jgi:hypothetical protein
MNDIPAAKATELLPGDLVLSAPNNMYRYLIGTILSIYPVGSPEYDEDSGNETDEIHVDFRRADYSPQRIAEIEAMFTSLNGKYTQYSEIPLDDIMMAPGQLMRITGVDDTFLRYLLSRENNVARFCALVLSLASTDKTVVIE